MLVSIWFKQIYQCLTSKCMNYKLEAVFTFKTNIANQKIYSKSSFQYYYKWICIAQRHHKLNLDGGSKFVGVFLASIRNAFAFIWECHIPILWLLFISFFSRWDPHRQMALKYCLSTQFNMAFIQRCIFCVFRCVYSRAAVAASLVFSYFSYVTSICCWSIGCVCAREENKIRAHFQCCVICFCFGWCHDSQWHYFWCMIMTWCMHINLYYYIEAFHILSSLKQNTNSKTLYALHIMINGIKANCDACCFVATIPFFFLA